MRLIFAIVLCLAFLIPSSAQDTPCTETNPCPIPLDVDAATLNFGGEATYTVTAGDWFVFDTFNTDEGSHEIAIADLDISFIVPSLDSEHGPYLMDAPGTYEVLDIESGATATLVITEEDVAASDEKEGPGAPFVVLVAALIGLALLRAKRSK